MIKAWKHLCTILHHKNLVRAGCFKIGLYKQGLLHDMSKYTPTEFLVGCKYYQGTMSPNNAEREDKGYSAAWLHHKGRNKHHMEYWIDYGVGDGRDGQKTHRGICGMKMPIKYVAEMYVDRVSASKNYQRDKFKLDSPLQYYLKLSLIHIWQSRQFLHNQNLVNCSGLETVTGIHVLHLLIRWQLVTHPVRIFRKLWIHLLKE